MKNKYFFTLFRTLVLMLPLSFSITSCEEFHLDNLFDDFNKQKNDTTKQENDTTSFALYQIAENSLSGWDEGFFYSNKDGSNCPYYIVSSTDSINGDIIVCLNQTDNTDVNKSLTFHFSKEGDVLGVLLPGYRLDAQSYEEKVVFIAYDVQGKAQGTFSVPYIKVDTLAMSMTRSPFFNSKGKISVSKTLKFAEFGKKVTNVLGNVYNLSEGNYGDVVADFLLGNMTGAVKSFFGRIFAPIIIKEILGWHYEEAKRGFMGNADIQISSVKRTSKTSITVEGKILNISSIPSNRLVVANGQMGYTSNKIFYGVAVGKNAYPGLYLNENCTNLRMVSKEVFSFTFYMEETPGEVFYFRPFLIPETKIQHEDDLLPDFETCIRYGEAKEFMDMNVELSNFSQKKCVNNGGEYNVQFTIDASIPGLFDDLGGWGFDLKSKSGYLKRYYSSDSYIPPSEKHFICDVTIAESDIEIIEGERLIELNIVPFVIFRNRIPSIKYYEQEDYLIKITEKVVKGELFVTARPTDENKAIFNIDISANVKVENNDNEQLLVNIGGKELRYLINSNDTTININEQIEYKINLSKSDFVDYDNYIATDNVKIDLLVFDSRDSWDCISSANIDIIYDEKPTITIKTPIFYSENKICDDYQDKHIETYYRCEIGTTGDLWISYLRRHEKNSYSEEQRTVYNNSFLICDTYKESIDYHEDGQVCDYCCDNSTLSTKTESEITEHWVEAILKNSGSLKSNIVKSKWTNVRHYCPNHLP